MKTNFIFGFPVPENPSTHFLVPVGIFGWNKKYVEGGFEYEECEYEVNFGLAPQNGELSPSVPESTKLFNFLFRAGNPERSSDSNSPQNLGLSVGQKLGARGIYTHR